MDSAFDWHTTMLGTQIKIKNAETEILPSQNWRELISIILWSLKPILRM